ncbi:MAG: DNA polymerase III subunit delta [Burkholderiaceae bacterium]
MATIKPERLTQALAGSPGLVWIHGNEPLLVLEAAQAVRSAAREAGHDEREVIEVERGFDPSQLQAAAASQSLFASRKLVEIRVGGRPPKALIDALEPIAAAPDPEVRWLLTSERPEAALLRSSAAKRIEDAAVVVAIFPIEREQLPGWIGARLRAQGLRAPASLIALIADRVQGNLLAADQEIRKLALLFEPGDLPADEAAAAVLDVARYETQDLVDALLLGQPARVLRCLAGLAGEGRAEAMVVWHLAETVRGLLRLMDARAAGEPLSRAMAAARIFGPRQRRFEAALGRLPRRQLEQALPILARADTIAKGLAAGPAWPMLRTLTLRLAGLPIGDEPRPATGGLAATL